MTGQPSRGQASGPQPTLASYASVAHVARVYDYLLGGKDNFAADREAAEQAKQINPDLAATAQANRAFLTRATSYLAAEAGVRQFLDLGTGMPSGGSIHEIAQGIAPDCRVVYVDHDPIVLAHARALLTSTPEGRIGYVDADLREPDKILAEAARTLDFGRPVALMLISVLHLLDDADRPQGVVRRLADALAPGSYLVISHAASDIGGREMINMASRLNELMVQQTSPRSHADVAAFFAGFDLIEPGLVRVPQWHPGPGDDTSVPAQLWAGLARKP